MHSQAAQILRACGGFMTRSIARRLASGLAAVLALVAVSGGALLSSAGEAYALTNCDVSDNSIDAEEAAFLTLINNYRAQNGLGTLTMSTNLNRGSTWGVVDMGTNNYFSHTDSLGRSPSQRAIDCGYPQGAGENIAAGTLRDTAAEVFEAWRTSPGHNSNMLNASYKQIGIARYWGSGSTYGWYWGTLLGTTDDGTSGGGTAPAPAAPTLTKATVTSPGNGATLPGASTSFAWTAGSGADEYFFYAGTSQGANNIYGNSTGLNRGVTLNNLPTNGSTVYIRLWTRFGSSWQFSDTTYRAATVSVGTVQTKATILTPAPGTTIGRSATFQWAPGAGASEFFFYAGTSPGSNNLYGRSANLNTIVSLTNLPGNGQTVYVRLWTRFGSTWQYNDYTYTSW